MQVEVYPIVYGGDKSKLPIVRNKDGQELVLISSDACVDDDMLRAFIIARRWGVQWVELRSEVVRDEVVWRNV